MGWGSGNLGGGSCKLFAAIGVTFPADSTCECTNGTKTLRAKSKNGKFVFGVPSAGEWTVRCFNGTDYESSSSKTSKSVEITSEGQTVNVELFFSIYLFKNGEINTELTGGINGTIQNEVIYFSQEISVGNNKTFTTKQKIDLTNVKSIMARMVSPNTVSAVYFRLIVDDTASNGAEVTTSSLISYEHLSSPFNSEEKLVTLDVSGLSGKYYLGYAWGVTTSASGARTVTGRIHEWWLE